MAGLTPPALLENLGRFSASQAGAARASGPAVDSIASDWVTEEAYTEWTAHVRRHARMVAGGAPPALDWAAGNDGRIGFGPMAIGGQMGSAGSAGAAGPLFEMVGTPTPSETEAVRMLLEAAAKSGVKLGPGTFDPEKFKTPEGKAAAAAANKQHTPPPPPLEDLAAALSVHDSASQAVNAHKQVSTVVIVSTVISS